MNVDLLEQMIALNAADLERVRDRINEEILSRGGTPSLRRQSPCPAKSFSVPEDVKHLESTQLDELTLTFERWLDSSKTPSQRRSRGRIWLTFLLLRFTGMRLGEALAIDDQRDFDFKRSVVIVRNENDREIPLPEGVCEEIRKFIDQPMNLTIRGAIFQLDQGFVRRKFSERAKECSIPREFLNPRVIRHSRAVELLRGGVPLPVVQGILGHQNVGLTANYLNFSERDIQCIVQHYVQKETNMKTSARNSFFGKVTAIRADKLLTEVELTTASGVQVVSVITNESKQSLDVQKGQGLIATIKAPWVILVKEDFKLKTSARNKFCGKISTINVGDISAEVIVDLPDGTKIVSLVTDESVKSLDLKIGDDICALVKAFSVILNAE